MKDLLAGSGWLLVGLALLLLAIAGILDPVAAALDGVLPAIWRRVGTGMLLAAGGLSLYFRGHWAATLGRLQQDAESRTTCARSLREASADLSRSAHVIADNLSEVKVVETGELYLDGARTHARRLDEVALACAASPIASTRASMTDLSDEAIPVVAAVVCRDGEVLLCQRHDGPHLALQWEFPGGKIEPGESPEKALAREILEELGSRAEIGDEVASVWHEYPEKTVWIRFYRAELLDPPEPHVHRAIAWLPRTGLGGVQVPPPNAVVVRLLLTGELDIH